MSNKLEAANAIIDSVKFNGFVNLNNSIQQISDELMDYNNYEDENENRLYLSKLGREGLRLNQIGMNLSRLFNINNGYRIYEERIWKIEKFIFSISRGNLTDKEKIHQVAVVMDEQQRNLTDMFFVEQIGVSGLNKEENIERIISILDIIVDVINEVSLDVKQGLKTGKYVMQNTDVEEWAWVELRNDNQFEFNRSGATSYRPMGTYSIKDNILILSVNESEVYNFLVDGDKLVFKSGEFADNLVKEGAVFMIGGYE